MNIIRIVSVLALFTLVINANAQTVNSRGIYTNKKELEDLPIGWMEELVFKTPSKPIIKNGWNYPASQVSISEKLVSWVQQTYTPVGLLGELKLSVLTAEPSKYKGTKSYGPNEVEKDNRFALPNTYGASAKFHYCLSKTTEHKFWPTPGNHCNSILSVMANNVELITQQIIALSTPDEYYCTMPAYTIGQPGVYDKDWIREMAVYRNFTNSPALQNYQHYLNPVAGGTAYIIIMTKDGKPLPLEQVTVSEFINQLEKQFPQLHQWALNDNLIYENYLQNAKKGMQMIKEKLKNNLKDYVYFSEVNKQINIIDLANIGSSDKLPYWFSTEKITDNLDAWGKVLSSNVNYPLLRLKKGVKEACATGGPQWIVFSLTDPLEHSYGGSVHLMDNFISHFNYEYVYNFFFGKEKVVEPYKPLTSSNVQAKSGNSVTPATLSATAQKKAADKSILFFEDFSSVAEGTTPATWTTDRSSSGEKPVVANLKEGEGKWLKLKGNASPKNLKLPISGDFELTYDLLVHKGDVPWGTPGIELQMQMATKDGEKRYTVDVTPGDMNRNDAAGWITLGLGGMPGCKVGNYYSITDFTGSKPVNKVTITVRKQGEAITILSNASKVYDCPSAFLPATTVSKINFYVNHKNVYYLGNVQVKKI